MKSATFDYVIVGAGSAGCVLANRLTASGERKVLLIEAGSWDTNPWIHVPMGFGKTFGRPSLTWADVSVPQPETANRSMAFPFGRVIGGSSSVNGLVYVRGQREDYDAWERLGNKGWAYKDVLPYFIRAENHQAGADEFHGTDGPLSVSPQRRHPLADSFIAAARNLQFPENDDFNGKTQEGIGYYETTINNGRRSSASVSYLRPIMNRNNLQVQTGASGGRIIFDGLRATAIEYTCNGISHRAQARREIVLCCGAIGTPHLLQVSGVGDQGRLAALNIDAVLHSPEVGQNLQDHLRIAAVFKASKPITLNDDYNNVLRRAWMGLRYLLFRSGPLCHTGGLAGGFLKSTDQVNSPDLQLILQPFSWEGRGERLHRFSGFAISVANLRPVSRGFVAIGSADPNERPMIVSNYLTAVEDQATLLSGLEIVRRISETEPLKSLIMEEIHPGAERRSIESLQDFCRTTSLTTFHLAGTCRMGADKGAVVDPQLKVQGLQGLRIADASIMPIVVSGNTNAPVIMIAEKASDMILKEDKPSSNLTAVG